MKEKIVCAILSAVVLLTGCNSVPVLNEKNTPDELFVEIRNATDTPNGVYQKYMSCAVDNEDEIKITPEQINYIISYVEKIEEPSYVEDISSVKGLYSEVSEEHSYLGSVYISYKKSGSKSHWSEEKYLFDEYPEGYEDFIKLLNEIDSEEPVILGEPMVMSADLIKKVTGFTDDMVTDGTIGDVLDKYPIDVFHLMNYTSGYEYFTIDSETRITDVFEYWPAFRALPTEIKNVESTEEEFQAYVEKLAEALGADPSTVADYRLGGKSINGQSIVVYQTCDIPEDYEYSDTAPYHLVDHNYYDGGEMDQDERHTIFYSADGKFAIAINGCLVRSYLGDRITPEDLYNNYLKFADMVG